ncbi:MAG: hypothetical protein ACLTW9_06860 [Enterocloster sp.]
MWYAIWQASVWGTIDVADPDEVEYIAASAVRALDNVIDLNFYPLPYAGSYQSGVTEQSVLGVSGYHHMLAKHGITVGERGTSGHLRTGCLSGFNYAAIRASANLCG